jgi:hypothetical protein
MRLLSLLIALVVLTMFTMTVGMYSKAVLIMSQDARANDAAIQAAQKKFSELDADLSPTNAGTEEIVIDQIPYTCTWLISDSASFRKAAITVSWNSLKGIKSAQFSRGL